MPKFVNGLQPHVKDTRDFKMGVLFKKTNIPLIDFRVAEPLNIDDQRDTDFCTGCGTAGAAEPTIGTLLSFEWQFAKIKQQEGDIDSFGATPLIAIKTGVNVGFLPKIKAPFSLETHIPEFLRDWQNWPKELNAIAAQYKKPSFANCEGYGADLFDSIRQSLWNAKQRNTKEPVMSGVGWRESWTYMPDGIINSEYEDNSYGHFCDFIGQKIINGVPYLELQNSGSEKIGNKGFFYFPREVVNKEFLFAYQYIDIPKPQAKVLNKLGLSVKWLKLAKLISAFI